MQTISRKDPSSIRVFDNKIAFYIVGFVDGEGSFNISFKIRKDYKHKVQIYPSFNISQKERRILEWIKHYLNCGTIRNRGDEWHRRRARRPNAGSADQRPVKQQFNRIGDLAVSSVLRNVPFSRTREEEKSPLSGGDF